MFNEFCCIMINMKYTIEELNENISTTYIINEKNFNKHDLKQALLKNSAIEIDFNFLNLGVKLYGKNKKSSIDIQKANCKKVKEVYKTIKKVIHIAKRKKYRFNNSFYIKNLKSKQNNNDYLLSALLELKFNTIIFNKMNKSILLTCEFLDRENALHNMCDFHDNRCAKHRARGFERSTGCCPSSCKFMDNCPCKTKNLSCKLIMCDYLVDMGYYFTPHTIPTLTHYMNPLERLTSIGMFFKSTRKTYLFMWTVRILEAIFVTLSTLTIISLFI